MLIFNGRDINIRIQISKQKALFFSLVIAFNVVNSISVSSVDSYTSLNNFIEKEQACETECGISKDLFSTDISEDEENEEEIDLMMFLQLFPLEEIEGIIDDMTKKKLTQMRMNDFKTSKEELLSKFPLNSIKATDLKDNFNFGMDKDFKDQMMLENLYRHIIQLQESLNINSKSPNLNSDSSKEDQQKYKDHTKRYPQPEQEDSNSERLSSKLMVIMTISINSLLFYILWNALTKIFKYFTTPKTKTRQKPSFFKNQEFNISPNDGIQDAIHRMASKYPQKFEELKKKMNRQMVNKEKTILIEKIDLQRNVVQSINNKSDINNPIPKTNLNNNNNAQSKKKDKEKEKEKFKGQNSKTKPEVISKCEWKSCDKVNTKANPNQFKLRLCALCLNVHYCCKEHQVNDWKEGKHKLICKPKNRL